MVLLKSLKFWVLLVSLLAYVSITYFPDVPLTEDTLLKIVLAVLAFFHIQPEVKALFGK